MKKFSLIKTTDYVPILGFFSSTRLYDILLDFSKLGKDFFREEIMGQVILSGHEKVLDVGCGTGTLLLELKKKHKDIITVGIDPDQKLLTFAQSKFNQLGLQHTFILGVAEKLPYDDNSFDFSFSTLVFHHLRYPLKKQALDELIRVTKPGGTITIADFRKIKFPFLARFFLLEDYASLHSNFKGDLQNLIRSSSLQSIKHIQRPHSLQEIHVLKKQDKL